MSSKNRFIELEVLEKKLDGWDFHAIEDAWSAHSPGLWVAKFISPEIDGRHSFCCLSLEIGEYLALFFSLKKSGPGWEIVEELAVKDNIDGVRDWLESIAVD
ncbi:MAG: hypothetical protein H7249_07495 [Chitinophagaceae bacterium]|nr:hypothetical protein [Oligoflexus sp.]